MQPTLRPYQPSDRPTIERLLADFQNFERAIEPDRRTGEIVARHYADYLLRSVASCSGEFWVADVDGGAVGYLTVWRQGIEEPSFTVDPAECAFVCDLYIDDAHRGKGIGRMLLEKAEEYARSQGLTRMALSVLAANARALKMYEREGWRPHTLTLVKDLVPIGSVQTKKGKAAAV